MRTQKTQRASKEQKQYWDRIARLGCILCDGPAEIAHAHGPSLTARGFMKPKGKKFRWQHWLVLPLCEWHHRLASMSLDTAMNTWEAEYGTVAMHIDLLIARTGIDVWARARSLSKGSI